MDRHTWAMDVHSESPQRSPGQLTRLRWVFYSLTEHATYRQRPTLGTAGICLLMEATRPTGSRQGRCQSCIKGA